MYLKNNKAQNVVCVLSLCQGEIYVEGDYTEAEEGNFFCPYLIGEHWMCARGDDNVRTGRSQY